MFCIGICLVGVCFGAFMGVYPSFTASRFGRTNAGINYGIMFIGFNAAGLVGPILMSRIYQAAGSYRFAFAVAMGFAVCGLELSFVDRKMWKQ